ncbi:ATPase with chaperone activity [Curvibacter sp. CHRR-16]|uniref:ATPase with chaperone activity n=1 Tax=Curvibacter sp. CHRR-16 TaxID=2835872 RepID=UPI001BD97679|nr:ATPase with chaperone activity [Curvibacter sp. CHRR-16]MBT0569579.1 ATPase with chaperone activity [Curvibacter sp. CHRR-16]
MSSDNQIIIPDAFLALYTDPLRHRLTTSKEDVAQRYELCEDLANLMTEQAAHIQFKTGCQETDVLEQLRLGLLNPDSGVTEAEGHWVVGRVGELLGWNGTRVG